MLGPDAEHALDKVKSTELASAALKRLVGSEGEFFQARISKDVQNTARNHMLCSLPSAYVAGM